jgi:hypothetical protein
LNSRGEVEDAILAAHASRLLLFFMDSSSRRLPPSSFLLSLLRVVVIRLHAGFFFGPTYVGLGRPIAESARADFACLLRLALCELN